MNNLKSTYSAQKHKGSLNDDVDDGDDDIEYIHQEN